MAQSNPVGRIIPPAATSVWSVEAARQVAARPDGAIAPIDALDLDLGLPDLDLWDMWHLTEADGRTVVDGGRSWWFFLATPRFPDPEARHDHARIRLLSLGADGWGDHGWTFEAGFSSGSREWSGSAVRLPGGTVRHFFTAAGRRGEPTTFEQRLFETTAGFTVVDGEPHFGAWTTPVESVVADGDWYAPARDRTATPAGIKGFRDPGYFRDPADGREYLFFTANDGRGDRFPDGVIGWATASGDGWTLLPPIISALGVNSELERPHVVFHAGRYYLFWSTHAHRFASGIGAPSGLYAMVAERIEGPWRPVNGSGLVAANPAVAPIQAYCWWVTQELRVASFVNYWRGGPAVEPATAADRRAAFGGVPAPFLALTIDGDRVAIT